MQVTLKVFATLRSYLSSGETVHTHDGSLRVCDLLRAYYIPQDEAAIILVNGLHSSLEKELTNGDTVSIFPPVGGG